MDRVHIEDLEVTGIIGINPTERVTPQTIRISATMSVDTRPAGASDDIQDAVNYRTVAKAIIAHVEQGSPLLVERLAQEIADLCLETDGRIRSVDVKVEKPGAVRHARSVGISITRSRVDTPEEVGE